MRLVDKITTGPDFTDENHSVTIEHYASDDDFTHKVKSFYTLSQKAHTRAKTFRGETAHMDAERLYHDIYFEVKYGR